MSVAEWPANNRSRLAHSSIRVRAIRRALGMTQRDFSFYLRVSVNTVSAWENGKTLPSPLAEQAIRNVAAEHGLDLRTLQRFGVAG